MFLILMRLLRYALCFHLIVVFLVPLFSLYILYCNIMVAVFTSAHFTLKLKIVYMYIKLHQKVYLMSFVRWNCIIQEIIHLCLLILRNLKQSKCKLENIKYNHPVCSIKSRKKKHNVNMRNWTNFFIRYVKKDF